MSRLWKKVRLKLSYALHRSRLDRDLQDEIQDHLLAEQEELARSGVDDPGSQARRRFGNPTLIKETSRGLFGFGHIENWLADLRYGLRGIRRDPGFAAVAVGVLALGIGANTAIFSITDATLLRPLPYRDSGRLVYLEETSKDMRLPVAYPNYLDWQKQNQVFEEMTAHLAAPVIWNGHGRQVLAGFVSASYMRTFQVAPVMGRGFEAEDDVPGAKPVVLIAQRFWRNHLSGDPAVLGSTLALNKTPYTVIGVLPESFRDARGAEVLMTITPVMQDFGLTRANRNSTAVFGRLRAGVGLEQARAQMDTIARRLAAQYPQENGGIGVVLTSLREHFSGGVRATVLLLTGTAGLVLLIACVNLANLLLARTISRERDLAVRTALGANRMQLVRQFLCESAAMSLAGGILAVALAWLAVPGLRFLIPQSLAESGAGLDARVLCFALGVAVLTALLCGVVPAVQGSRVNLSEAMKEGGRGSTGGGRRWLRAALAVSEMALATILLVGAGLLIRSIHGLLEAPLGFQPDQVMVVDISVPYSETAAERVPSFFARLADRISALPGVRYAGATKNAPFSFTNSWMAVLRLDRPEPVSGELSVADYRSATPGYFQAIGLPLIKGRMFNDGDGRPPHMSQAEFGKQLSTMVLPAVVNQTMARRIWPGEDPIGKRFRMDHTRRGLPVVEVIGVVGDLRHHDLSVPPRPEYYIPQTLWPADPMFFAVRADGNPLALTSAIRGEALALDRDAVLGEPRLMRDLIDGSVAERRFRMLLLGAFAGLALVLAAAGLYGVLAYSVAQRRQEIGVRMAMGATLGQILGPVLGQALALAGVSLALGTAAAFALTRLIASMLYGVKPADPATFVSVGGVLCATALLASFVPALRAARVDPARALRNE